jgi:hypothetical protein
MKPLRLFGAFCLVAILAVIGVEVYDAGRAVRTQRDVWSGFSDEISKSELESASRNALLILDGRKEDEDHLVAHWSTLRTGDDETLDFARAGSPEPEATFTFNRMPLTFETRAKALWQKEMAGFPRRKETLPRLSESELKSVVQERIRRLVPPQLQIVDFDFRKDALLADCFRVDFKVGFSGLGYVDRAGYSVAWFDPYGRVLEFWQGGPYPLVEVPTAKLSQDQALTQALSLIGETDRNQLCIADGLYELKDGSVTLMTMVARKPTPFIDNATYHLYSAGHEPGRVMVDRVSGDARIVQNEERSPFLERTERDRPRR